MNNNMVANDESKQLISEIQQLQTSLKDLTQKVESVREERNQLAAENEVLVKYISNLVQQYGNVMDTSGNGGISSFQTAATASDNNRQSQPSAFIGRLNRIFSPSSASSNSAKSAIPGHSKNNSSYNIGGPGGGVIGRPST